MCHGFESHLSSSFFIPYGKGAVQVNCIALFVPELVGAVSCLGVPVGRRGRGREGGQGEGEREGKSDMEREKQRERLVRRESGRESGRENGRKKVREI